MDKFTKNNLYLGALGEKVVYSALKHVFKRKNGYNIKANQFNNQYQYCCGQGMDLTLQNMQKGYANIACFEVKNLKMQNKPYGTDYALKHILSRAKTLTVNDLKVLIITYKKLLTQNALQLLKLNGWLIVEVGELLTSSFFKTNKLYALATKIKNILVNVGESFIFNTLSKLVYNRFNSNTISKLSTIPKHNSIHNIPIPNIQKQHDTPVTSALKQYLVDSKILNSMYYKTLPNKLKPYYLRLGHEDFKDWLIDPNNTVVDYC
jgi:hypothetical protein